MIIGGIALAVIVLVVAVVLISSSSNKSNTVSPTLPSISTTVTSPSSTTPTTPTTTDPNATAVAALKARVPSSYQSTCSPLADSDKRATFRSYPGITCNPNSTLSVFFYQLPNPTVMNDEYNRNATGLPTGNCDPNVSSTFRESNVYTLGSSQRGRALCYIGSDNMARMEWTDDALNTYGVIAATDSSAARQQVYQFWRDSGALNR